MWTMAMGAYAYTATDNCPVPVKALATRNDEWLNCSYTDNLCRQVVHIVHVNFVWEFAHMKIESWISKSRNFMLKLKDHHLGKFFPRGIAHYTVQWCGWSLRSM